MFLVSTSFLIAADPSIPHTNSIYKSSIQEWKSFDGNNIQCMISSDGPYADYRKTSSSGLFWPKGSTKTPVYTSGIWIVGKHRATGSLRTAVQQYQSEFSPGTIQGIFNTSTNRGFVSSSRVDSLYRVYKIRKGDNSKNNIDYKEWPGDLGAPYNDINNNGVWDRGIDTPKLYGDQTLWCVYNDADSNMHREVGTTPPMGLEVHALYYGFSTTSPLENTMFIRWKIINKSDAVYDSLFFGLFSDFDLGDANDDIDGYDTTLSLAYVFNADNFDSGSNGYGTPPPAEGTVFLGGKPELHPYAYPVWNKSPEGDPPLGFSVYPAYAFNYLRGLKKFTGEPNINPITNLPDRFAFSGDPVSNTGWTRTGSGYIPDDKRSLLSLGPITLAPGDTQEVNAAYVISLGRDNLESLKQLRNDAAIVHDVFDANLSYPKTEIAKKTVSDSTTLNITIDTHTSKTKGISLNIIDEQTLLVRTSVQMFDNGTHGDIIADDRIFSCSLSLSSGPIPVRIDAEITNRLGNVIDWTHLKEHIPLSVVTISNPTIYSDDLNHDGRINPGEDVRFGVTINNTNVFNLQDCRVNNNSERAFISFPSIRSHDSTNNHYEAENLDRYLSFSLPSDYSQNSVTQHLIIGDSNGNQWDDSVEFPVEQWTKRISPLSHIQGRANFDVEVNIIDRTLIKDHLYILRGVDSGYSNYGFSLKDSTENTICIPVQSLRELSVFNNTPNHLIPVVDGFKIRILTPFSYPIFSPTLITDQSTNWFSPYLIRPSEYMPKSTVHFADVHTTIVKFSTITSFVDNNYNLIFDPSERYTFDISNTDRTQKAYLYTANQYIGFIDIPFAVYKDSANAKNKLGIVIFRSDTVNTRPLLNVQTDGIYVLGEPYDMYGKTFNPTLGGINLVSQFNTTGSFPYYYYLRTFLSQEPLRDTVDLVVNYDPKFSSRDAFLFNPTEFIIEEVEPITQYQLFQNFPNPFNPATTIRYSLPKQALASITIYNILGQKVRTVVNEVKNAGTYEVEWNGRSDGGISVASGMYFYRLTTESVSITKKMLMLK